MKNISNEKPRVRVIRDAEMNVNDTVNVGVFFGEALGDYQNDKDRKENENGG